MDVGERIRKARLAADLTQAGLAKTLEVTKSSVSQWEKGETYPRPEKFGRLITTLGLNIADLLPPDALEHLGTAPDLPALYAGKLEPGFLEIDNTEYVSIGRFDAALSAGTGSLLEADPEPLGYQLFEAQWLRSVTRSTPGNLAVVQVDGDSMQHTFNDGDWVMVDLNQKSFDREGVYAMRVGNAAWIKRLSLNFKDELIQIISDNDRYPLKEVDEGDIQLIGRVVCIVARKV
ncbi:MAG: S24 family peptidase [Pseudomonadota bacterium]